MRRRTTAVFGRNESPDGAGRFREARGTPVVVGIEKERLEDSRRSFVNRIRWRLFARFQTYFDPLGRFAVAVFHRSGDEDVAASSTPAPALLFVNTSLESLAVIEAPA